MMSNLNSAEVATPNTRFRKILRLSYFVERNEIEVFNGNRVTDVVTSTEEFKEIVHLSTNEISGSSDNRESCIGLLIM